MVHSNSTFNDEKLGQSNSPADTDINLINNLPNDNVKNIDKCKFPVCYLNLSYKYYYIIS